MPTRRRSYWLFIALACALVLALAVHLAVNELTREKPNYDLIEPGLYVGAYVDAPPLGTSAVLNLSQERDNYTVENYRWQPIADGPPAPTLEWLGEQVRFIDEQRRAGRTVFIHCNAGVSRSGLVAAAYVMARDRVSRDEALNTLRTKRAAIQPNGAFMALLSQWQGQLRTNAK